MKKLLVYADFDWLKEIELIGELSYESLRGSDSYAFQFNDEWLKRYGNLFISADLNNYKGLQYTQPEKDIFGCFSDALPDRWGRTLLNRREQILATEEKRPVRPYLHLIICWGLMIHLAWVDFASKRHPMETLSTQATPYVSHH